MVGGKSYRLLRRSNNSISTRRIARARVGGMVLFPECQVDLGKVREGVCAVMQLLHPEVCVTRPGSLVNHTGYFSLFCFFSCLLATTVIDPLSHSFVLTSRNKYIFLVYSISTDWPCTPNVCIGPKICEQNIRSFPDSFFVDLKRNSLCLIYLCSLG